MNETLGCAVVDILYTPFPRMMSDDWNGDWFTADLSNYASLLTNHTGDAEPHDTPTQQTNTGVVRGDYPARYQYEYGQPFGASSTGQLPLRGGGRINPAEYNAAQQASQQTSSSLQSSPRFAAPLPGSGARISLNRSQPPTPVTTAFPPILPSQKLHTKPASGVTSTYAPQQSKRGPPDTESQGPVRSPKRRPSAVASVLPAQGSSDISRQTLDMSEEERLLIQLKQDQNLPWKDIAKEFESRFGRPFQVPALQMRYKRLRERLRPWTKEDLTALEAAYEYWESNKFEIIANKMLDFGVQDRWPARYCERKWEQQHPENSKSDASKVIAERPKPLQTSMPGRFDTDLKNMSVEWPMPSPPRDTATSQLTNPLSELGLTKSTIPTTPFLLDGSTNQRPRHDNV